MQAFYELERENSEWLSLLRNGNYIFSPHFHVNIEIFIIKKGKYEIFYNGKNYILENNSIAFFDNYTFHGYNVDYVNKDSEKDDCVIIIPRKYLAHFNEFRKKNKLADFIVKDEHLVDDLLQIVDGILINNKDENVEQSCVDLILSLIEQKLNYSDKYEDSDTLLLRKMLEYIENNFRGDVSLKIIAKQLGYSTEHLSRTFHGYFNMSISSYVNTLRLDYVEKVAKSKGKKISEVIYESGFNSLQTYYRFKKAQSKA